jgi:hypothetical protein
MQSLFTNQDIKTITKYASNYELLPWVDEDELSRCLLYENPNAIHYIEKEAEKDGHEWTDLIHLCENPNAINILDDMLEDLEDNSIDEDGFKNYEFGPGNDSQTIRWEKICRNPNAVHILEKIDIKNFIHDERILKAVLKNPNALDLIQDKVKKIASGNYPDVIFWSYLLNNPNAIYLIDERIEKYKSENNSDKNSTVDLEEILRTLPDRMNWYRVFENPNAVHIIEERIRKEPLDEYEQVNICFNPGAIHLLPKDKKGRISRTFIWKHLTLLARNPSALPLIERYIKNNKPFHSYLSSNPSIFELKESKEVYETLTEL